MDSVDLPIKPSFDGSAIDKAISKLKELEAKGFTIPVNFVGNLEALKTDAEAVIAKLRGQWQGLSSDLSAGNNKLLQELDRLGESTAASRLRRGFASVREEVLVLDNLISQLSLKGDPGAGLAKGLAAGRIADIVKSGQAAGDIVSFAGYGEQAEKATAAQEKFAQAESRGVGVAKQSEEAIAAESGALKAKALQFESARAAAAKFQSAEQQMASQAQRSTVTGGGTGSGSAEALQRQRSAALIQAGNSDVALQRQRSAALLAESRRAAQEEAAEAKRQQSAREALQRQRSQALIRQAKEQERAAATGGFRGVLNTVGTASTFIATYGAIDGAVRALKAGAEASVEFERKLATLSVIFRGTKEESRALALETLNVAAAFGQDGIAALEVAKDFARFGGTAADVLEAVRVVSMAANVAELPLEETSKHFQAIMASNQLQVGQLAGVLGMLNTASNTANVTVKQLLEGLARVGPLAKEAGIGIAEQIGFETVISGRTGRPGAEGGNALKSLISRMAKPEIQESLSGAGINVTEKNGDLKTASTLINELFLAYQKLGSAEREELLIKVAGTQQAARVAALLDGYVASQEIAIRASRDLTSSDRENMAVRETLSSQLGTLVAKWQTFWAAGAGAGQASGIQSDLVEITKLLGNLLSGLTALQNVSSGVQSALKNALGDKGGSFVSKAIFQSPIKDINEVIAKVSELFKKSPIGKYFETEADRASAALQGFNAEVDKLQKMGEADEAASRLLKTIGQAAPTADPVKLEKMTRAAAVVSTPGDLPGQANIREQLNALAKAGDFIGFNNRLEELGVGLDADRAKNLDAANAAYQKQIRLQQEALDKKRSDRSLAEKRNESSAVEQLNKEIENDESGLEALGARAAGSLAKQYAEAEAPTVRGTRMLQQQKVALREITDQAEAYGQLLKAIPSLDRRDELTSEMQVLDVRGRLLELEKQRLEQSLRVGRVTGEERSKLQEAVQTQIEAVSVAKEKVNQEMRYAEIIKAVKQASMEASAVSQAYGFGETQTDRIRNTVGGLTGPGRGKDAVTGLPLNIATAQADFAGARNPIEQATALARLKEFAITLQNSENDLVRRRFQLEGEITGERRKQGEEASKNLLMAGREDQLRAALAAKFASQRGGKGFSANEFEFFDPATKQSIEKTNPELLPPEFKNRLRELTDESASLALAFLPLRDRVDSATRALADLHLPAPAVNPGGLAGLPPSIDVSPVSTAIVQSGGAVQTALELLGTTMTGQLDAIADIVDQVSSGLSTRIAYLERGSGTASIGRAQGASTVLA